MLALRRSVSLAQKRVASSQVACFSDVFQNKEKAAEAAFFKYVGRFQSNCLQNNDLMT